MFTFDQIKELLELVSRHRIHGLEIERAGFRLKISGAGAVALAAAAADTTADPSAAAAPTAGRVLAAAAPAANAASEIRSLVADLHVVTSPIVGTFYAAPSPDAAAFVRIGDRVRRGQVLCIVEAMKLMNEIECDADGLVAEIYPKNAQPVEFGEPLFGIRAD